MPKRRSKAGSKVSTEPGVAWCRWCHERTENSPYRSPLPDIPGAREVVCGPECPDRPEKRRVISVMYREGMAKW